MSFGRSFVGGARGPDTNDTALEPAEADGPQPDAIVDMSTVTPAREGASEDSPTQKIVMFEATGERTASISPTRRKLSMFPGTQAKYATMRHSSKKEVTLLERGSSEASLK